MNKNMKAYPNYSLRRAREIQGWTQQQVADWIEAPHSFYISRWENGIAFPNGYYRQKLSKLFEKSLEELGLLREESTIRGIRVVRERYSGVYPLWNEENAQFEDFHGRDKELTVLQQWLVTERCRIITLLGVKGIGKSSLATVLVKRVKTDFEAFFQYPLQYKPPLRCFLQDFLKNCSCQAPFDLPDDTEELLSIFLSYVREHRYLFVFDNIEAILQTRSYAGYYQPEYEEYGKLFRIIGENKHESCLLLLSCEELQEIAILERSILPIRSLQLKGLEDATGRKILLNDGVSNAQQAWDTLVHYYAGNPLALKLVSQLIQEVFGGDGIAFLQEKTIIFSDIRYIFNQQFERLSNLEQEIVYWLAIEDRAVTLLDLQRAFTPQIAKQEVLDILRSLQRRYFIETSGTNFKLQSLLQEYVTDRLIRKDRISGSASMD